MQFYFGMAHVKQGGGFVKLGVGREGVGGVSPWFFYDTKLCPFSIRCAVLMHCNYVIIRTGSSLEHVCMCVCVYVVCACLCVCICVCVCVCMLCVHMCVCVCVCVCVRMLCVLTM